MTKAELVWITEECNGSKMCQNRSPKAFEVIDMVAHPIGEAILKKNVAPDPDEPEAEKLVKIPDGVELILIPEGRSDYKEAAKECPCEAIIIKKVEIVDSVVNAAAPPPSD